MYDEFSSYEDYQQRRVGGTDHLAAMAAATAAPATAAPAAAPSGPATYAGVTTSHEAPSRESTVAPAPPASALTAPTSAGRTMGLVRLSCPGNTIMFTMGEVSLSLRSFAVEMGYQESDVGVITKTNAKGPYTAAVTFGLRTRLNGETIDIYQQPPETGEAEFNITILDDRGFSEVSNARFEDSQRTKAIAIANKPRERSKTTVRLFYHLPQEYTSYSTQERAFYTSKLKTALTEEVATLQNDKPFTLNFATAEDSTTGITLNQVNGFLKIESYTMEDYGRLDWTKIKFHLDESCTDIVETRLSKDHLTPFNLSNCCFRPLEACKADRDRANGTGRCSAREQAYELKRAAVRNARRGAPSSGAFQGLIVAARDDRKRRIDVEKSQARAELLAGVDAKRAKKVCERWTKGFCARVGTTAPEKCSRPHGPAESMVAATKAIDCASWAGGKNFNVNAVCPWGPSTCPYNHPAE